MQEAGLQGLIKFIFYFIVFSYLLRLIGRYIVPIFIKRTVNKMEDRFRQQQEAQAPQEEIGKTSIDKKPKKEIKKDENSGEYIDFEEIE
jgi:hypothetical protein